VVQTDRALQLVSATLLTAATVVLLIGIIQGPQSGWVSWQVLGGFGAAVLLFGAWIAFELRAAHPMLDPRLFRIPLLRGAALGTVVIFFAMFALFYVNGLLPAIRQGLRRIEDKVRRLAIGGDHDRGRQVC
jgi:hypothetical protein